MKKESVNVEYSAPEGGWGWCVVFAYGLNNIMVIPIFQVFGLLYRNLFSRLGLTSVHANTVVTTNLSLGMLIGILNGPLLKTFGYRKVAIAGAILFFVGNLLTSQATSFVEFMICYGFIVSIATNLLMASFNLALNTYFVKKRAVATGIAMAITGIGPIIMPLIIHALMVSYGTQGAGMVLAGLSLHTLVGAILLEPIKRHQVLLTAVDQEAPEEDKKAQNEEQDADLRSLDEGNGKNALVRSVASPSGLKNAVSYDSLLVRNAPDNLQHFLSSPALNMDSELGALLLLEDDILAPSDDADKSSEPRCSEKNRGPPVHSLDDIVKPQRTMWQKIVEFFDLDLFRDPIYMNIAFGLSLAFIGEMNFSLMIPFLFQDRNYGTERTAVIMSTIAGADTFTRFIFPFVGSRTKSYTRVNYLFGLALGVIFRIVLTETESYTAVIAVAVGLGIAKGIRSVYMVLVIPNYVPLSKLPSATGLEMVINGILLIISGPLLGLVRDRSVDYTCWMYIINCFSLATCVMWSIEMVLRNRRKKKEKNVSGGMAEPHL